MIIAKIRNRNFFKQMSVEDGNLFLGPVIVAFLAHSIFLRRQ